MGPIVMTLLGTVILVGGLSKGMCLLEDHKVGSDYKTLLVRSTNANYLATALLAGKFVVQYLGESPSSTVAEATWMAVNTIAFATLGYTYYTATPSRKYSVYFDSV